MAMCKLETVKAARKAQGKCERCQTPIEAGSAYRWWKGRYTSKHIRCMKSSCSPQPWELETNPLRQEAMQGSTAHENATSSVDDAATAATYLREAIGIAESLAEQLNERVSSWESTNLENSSQAEACKTSAEEFESYVIEAESIADELEAMDAPPTADDVDANDYVNDDDPEQSAEDALAMLEQEYEAEVESHVSGLPDWPELDLGA